MPRKSQGRVNQKLRTRKAIVDAARSLLQEGETPTVAQAAEAALVSRTTAYRYFPTQESLLLEVTVTVSVEEVEALLAKPFDGERPEERVLAIIDALNRFVAANEALFRTAQRHYMDTWLAAERSGEGHDQPMRAGRRREWIATALEPLRSVVPDEKMRELERSLCLVMGGEAFTVMRDVCQLEPDEAVAALNATARAMVDDTLRQ